MTEEIEMKRGQVYYLKYDDAVGGEMSVGRPGLIVSNNGDIDEMDTVIVVFLTTGLRKSKNVVKVMFNGRPQYIHCSQLKTVDKSRLSEYLGELNADDMKKVGNMLALAMSYNSVVTVEKNDNDDKLTEITVERDAYKKLYEKALEKLAEIRFGIDTTPESEEKGVLPIEESECFEVETGEEEVVVEPDLGDIPLDISALQKKFQGYDAQQAQKKKKSLCGWGRKAIFRRNET